MDTFPHLVRGAEDEAARNPAEHTAHCQPSMGSIGHCEAGFNGRGAPAIKRPAAGIGSSVPHSSLDNSPPGGIPAGRPLSHPAPITADYSVSSPASRARLRSWRSQYQAIQTLIS